jgi:hypothetical protein
MFRHWSVSGLVLLALALASGCNSSSGPSRYQLNGEISFNGQPIPAGVIVFTPDTAQGNSGPQGIANIKDGKYDTAAPEGRGVGGGPTIVRVTGQGPDQSLWCEYEYKVDLPKDKSALKIEVPLSAANRRPAAPAI